MSSHVLRFGRPLIGLIAAAMLLMSGSAEAKLFKLQPLSPQDAARLNDQAKPEYEQGLNWVSKIDYPLALQHFNKAVEAQPDNIYLRYVAVQTAVYLGDTRMGKNSVEYYDQALKNLKTIDASPSLNPRERERAQGLIDLVGKLKDSVGQRDLNRTKFGRELAKQYAEIIYKKSEEESKEKSPEQEALERTGVIKKEGEKNNVATGVDVLTLYKRPRRQGTRTPITAPATTTEPAAPGDTTVQPDAAAGGSTTPPATK